VLRLLRKYSALGFDVFVKWRECAARISSMIIADFKRYVEANVCADSMVMRKRSASSPAKHVETIRKQGKFDTGPLGTARYHPKA